MCTSVQHYLKLVHRPGHLCTLDIILCGISAESISHFPPPVASLLRHSWILHVQAKQRNTNLSRSICFNLSLQMNYIIKLNNLQGLMFCLLFAMHPRTLRWLGIDYAHWRFLLTLHFCCRGFVSFHDLFNLPYARLLDGNELPIRFRDLHVQYLNIGGNQEH